MLDGKEVNLMKNIVNRNVWWVLRFDIKEPGKYHRREWDNDPVNGDWLYVTEQWMTPEEYFIFQLTVLVGDYESKYWHEVDDFTYQNAEELFYLFYA